MSYKEVNDSIVSIKATGEVEQAKYSVDFGNEGYTCSEVYMQIGMCVCVCVCGGGGYYRHKI